MAVPPRDPPVPKRIERGPDRRSDAVHRVSSEERYRRIVETSAEGIWILDEHGCTIFANERMGAILGYPPSELHGTFYSEYLVPQDLERGSAGFRQRMDGDQKQRDYRFRRKDGTLVWCSISASITQTDQGEFLGILGMFTDITERKRAEIALRESEVHLRLALEAGKMGTWSWDNATRELTWSEGHYRLFGLEPFSVTPTCESWLAQIHPEDRERIEAGLQSDDNPSTYYEEYRVIWADQSVHWIESRGQWERDQDGHPTLIRAVVADVTARKLAEQQMLRREKLEGLGLLAGGVAHDFNNLLAGILGGASFAQELLPQSHEAWPMLDIVVRSSERAAHLTRQLLNYAGQGKGVIESVDIDALIAETVELIRSSIPRNVAIEREQAPGRRIVDGDSTQLQQVVMNMVLNAGEAIVTGTAGHIRISTNSGFHDRPALAKTAPAFDLKPGDYTVIEIADNGCGMRPETLTHIFDPFFTTKFTGRGLGLSAAHGIVRAHGGAILAESEPGVGTLFRIWLPSSTKLPTVTREEAKPEGVTTGATVLVIDDEEMVRTAVRGALARAGFSVVCAASATEAVALIQSTEEPIALVLLDMNMPGMSGVETLGQLRANGLDSPVLVCSGFGEVEVRRHFEGLAIAGVIEKPFRARQLAERVNETLRKKPGDRA